MALKPPKTAWIQVDVTFVDRNTERVRVHENLLMEVVSMGGPDDDPEILLQDLPTGTHRLLPASRILNMSRRKK